MSIFIKFSLSHFVAYLDKSGDGPQEVGVYGLGGLGHVDVMQQTMNDRHNRALDSLGSFLQHLHRVTGFSPLCHQILYKFS